MDDSDKFHGFKPAPMAKARMEPEKRPPRNLSGHKRGEKFFFPQDLSSSPCEPENVRMRTLESYSVERSEKRLSATYSIMKRLAAPAAYQIHAHRYRYMGMAYGLALPAKADLVAPVRAWNLVRASRSKEEAAWASED
ncbi:predicted protein [Histoplasma capsulatum G186AR]|uniref:Uncharacterized protein n=1 Tax=Ajellomyces capsulatus (strain G186AR / H82 / ATCC MYA-2454 / RMSCC 2432) TaxID=447093 RepID=C0NKN9_AJECG|nr:uncharacterized protein HCBG_03719 [Histoplasma capsulatum G186AR]EEH08430.1 predicted protein [Histoplasma capsulatum G186AR]